MCRKNKVAGFSLMALGLGILLGFCLESWFLCAVSAVSLMALGFFLLRIK